MDQPAAQGKTLIRGKLGTHQRNGKSSIEKGEMGCRRNRTNMGRKEKVKVTGEGYTDGQDQQNSKKSSGEKEGRE